MDWIRESLDDLDEKGLRRRPPELQEREGERLDGRTIRVEGRRYVSFASNDYLGLAGDERLARAAAEAAARYGAGAGASRLIVGTLPVHRELERRLAAFKGTDDAILFTTGYQAGIGAVTSLAGRGDAVVMDKLSHACLIDGARASGARVRTYPHLKVSKLAELLDRERGGAGARRLVVTDSLFSMDGDLAPLGEILELAERHDAMLLVDEAHATGTVGPGGRGLVAELGLTSPRLVQMGTLSKALGSVGGFVAGSAELVEYLRNTARSYIYSTAPAPAAAGAALAALDVIEREPNPIERLRANVRRLGEALPSIEPLTPVVPVILGDAPRAVEAQAALREAGLWVPAIRPPSVPPGTSRLRVSVSAAHTEEDIDRLAGALRGLASCGTADERR